MEPSKAAIDFFYKHAGYSHDPRKETAEQGRRRGAIALAKAELYSAGRGWRVEWKHDADADRSGIEDAEEVLGAVLRDGQGKMLDSLWGIADPDRNYRRVVEAELALEAMKEHRRGLGFSGAAFGFGG